jgi:phosphoserine phosphatase
MDPTFVATIFVAPDSSSSSKPVISEECLGDFANSLKARLPAACVSHTMLCSGDQSGSPVAEAIVRAGGHIKSDQLREAAGIDLFEKKHGLQVVLQKQHVSRRYKRLVIFDMDSTLIQQEVIDEIARRLGVQDQVSAITERAMNGELDFAASLRERCALLRGVPATVFDDLKAVISLSPGAADLVRAFKKLGCRTAVLSGGFTPLTSWLAGQLGLDHAHANHLAVSPDGKSLTGELEGVIVDSEKKRELLQSIAQSYNIPLSQVVAVGDGANDLPMLHAAGLGVAFNAKPRVQEQAPARLNSSTLLDILYLLGLSESEIRQLVDDEA